MRVPTLNAPPASATYRQVNVIVPIYRGVEETRACLESLRSSQLPETSHITLIDDCSPEPNMASLLDEFAGQPCVTLLRNSQNLGFVASVNRGMQLLPDHDALLLNADTKVPVGWLQRLQQSLYSAPDIGSVTPFSNNATICSYPRFCCDNAIPEGFTPNELDRLFQSANPGQTVEIPTAVGFCMLIRRECLDRVGLFDLERFGRGYGEENDFCMRATDDGWRHVLCCDTFVFHAGAVSFAGEHDARVREAQSILGQRHPKYPLLVSRHVLADPAAQFRHRIDLTRLHFSCLPIILAVCHDLGGGVLRHVHELARQFSDRAEFLLLRAAVGHQIEIAWCRNGEDMRLFFHRDRDWAAVSKFLREIGVVRIHFHHWLGLPDNIWQLPELCDVPYDITIHDYHTICPRINLIDQSGSYCGEPDESTCNRCLAKAPRVSGGIANWRRNWYKRLARAERVIAPSKDTANRIRRYFHGLNCVVAPHPDLTGISTDPVAISHDPTRPLVVLLIGALSKMKGGAILEACAFDAESRRLPIQFHLIGYAWRPLKIPGRHLKVTGAYRDEDLQQLVATAKADIAWFPAIWPETYSYTLSAALEAKLPIAISNLGALVERTEGRSWTWTGDWRWEPHEWNDFFIAIREQNFLAAKPPQVAHTVVRSPSWDWKSDYQLKYIRQRSNDLSQLYVFANAHSKPRLAVLERGSFALRRLVLFAGLRLRRHPWTGRLISLIPAELQHYLRRWILN